MIPRRFRFIHAADLHLDSPFKGLANMPEPLLERVRNATLEALERIVNLALEQQVDFVLFCGDLYDSMDRSLRAQFRFQEAVIRLSKQGIHSFIIHGNHDPVNGYNAMLEFPENVHVFPAEQVGYVELRTPDGQVYASIQGISYPQAAVMDNLAERYEVKRTDIFNIAMLHGNVDGMQGHDRYAPCSLQQLRSSGFDYWALGHIHAKSVLSEQPWVVYSGNPQGRHMKENGERGVYLVEVDESRHVKLTFVATDTIRWCEQCVNVGSADSEQVVYDALIDGLHSVAQQRDGRSILVRLVCQGSSPLIRELRHREDRLSDLLAEIRRIQEDLFDQAVFVWPIRLDVEFTGQHGAFVGHEEGNAFISELLRFSRSLREGELHAEEREAFVRDTLHPLYGNFRIRQQLGEPDQALVNEWIKWAEEYALALLMEGNDA